MCNTGYQGVWVNDSKICAIGVHSKLYITYHGLAINCNVDLNYFNYIIPCGIEDKKVGSLTSITNRNITVKTVESYFLESFEQEFNAKLEIKNEESLLLLSENLL